MRHEVCGCCACDHDVERLEDAVEAGAAARESDEARSMLERLLPGRPKPWQKLDIIEGIKAIAEGRWR